ncbi:alpha-amylase family glycosyl hydrolase [Treponema endosymbiont of Eucomonympha sp.]|uniref:alpha-amylase family glycosyl hydrolase n=1 Tax=Treponema endosymbiont of Eucomonympha sp. TaxID=1580831 RepID=UPI000786675A|nr:alpha-amylase family glycosyl hydrolase [Treponema endosymbiont of Eucomonympha sp.]
MKQRSISDFLAAHSALSWNEFHISRRVREACRFDDALFASSGNAVLADVKAARLFAQKLNRLIAETTNPDQQVKASDINAMGLIDEALHLCCGLFRQRVASDSFDRLLAEAEIRFGKDAVDSLLGTFCAEFSPFAVYKGQQSVVEYLAGSAIDGATGQVRSNRIAALEELLLLQQANENPAFKPFTLLFSDAELAKNPFYAETRKVVTSFFRKLPPFGPNNNDLITMLKEPVAFSPYNLRGQLDYILNYWTEPLGIRFDRTLSGVDFLTEEHKAGWSPTTGDSPPMAPYSYDSLVKEYERFSADRDWMPKVVLLAKTTLVWLAQLSRTYGREIARLDQIPDEELNLIAERGFTALWLIGLWERSHASSRIKRLCGNSEAAASAYSLYDYEIADNLGGWGALDNLRKRLHYRGVRLAADMVPNHTGIDAKWVMEHPDLFMQRRDCPFPQYSFNGENLSQDSRVNVYLEDHYYTKNDCAVVFKRVDSATGDTRFIYHGNDGTGLPWNDTAQINFLNPAAREEVIQKILHVARNFPIIRFDAAMVLAKKHIRRLWYPEPGHGGDIATRAESAMSAADFERAIPEEFWREVVDRVASEVPDTLLLAEAFWMMEGYFVRTLGMHRVYNSAFMNMLKKEENQKYRETIKNTMEFDPQVMKRFVNFMNNPDEETAVAQFGTGDKYFGVCTLLVTMPGLPMVGHGQIEGFTEKYGMEYVRDYQNETSDRQLLERHEREIFPLMKKRSLFAGSENFLLYDVWNNGSVNENVFAYSNSAGNEYAVVFYNNTYERASGWINRSTQYMINGEGLHTKTLGEALGISDNMREFYVFREMRSGLWYTRSSVDILRNGLFVALNGFECQVLVDIRRETDDETGKWALLNHTLAGKGVPDISVALREIFLKDLYTTFGAFASVEFFDAVKTLSLVPVQGMYDAATETHMSTESSSATAEKPRQILDAALEKVRPVGVKFFQTLASFINGNYGAAEVLGRELDMPKTQEKTAKTPSRADTVLGTAESAAILIYVSDSDYEELWEQFSARMTHFVSYMQKINRYTASNTKKPPARDTLLAPLADSLGDIPALTELLAGFIMLYSLDDIVGKNAPQTGARDLITQWGLDYKFVDIVSSLRQVPRATLAATAAALTEIFPLASLPPTAANLGKTAHGIAAALLDAPSAAVTLGKNTFSGQVWFNKELSDKTFALAVLFPLLVSAEKPDKLSARAKLYETLIAAREKSGYKADVFLKALGVEETEKD